MAKVYIPQACAKEGVAYLLQQGYEVTVGSNPSTEEFIIEVADYDAVLLRTAPCPEAVLAAGKKLQVVARHGVGYDNVDIAAAERLGIWVTNTPQALSDSVAEYTLTAVMMAAKNVLDCSKEMYKGNFFYKNTHKGLDLFGKTLGVVGFGRIGRAVAKKAHFGLDMNVLAYDPFLKQEQVPEYVKLCSWEELFAQADFITLHLPGGEANRNAVSAKEFDLMKPTAVLVNAARGEVVDEVALDKALKEGKLAKAVLDVQSKEPPEADYLLYQNEKVILTPHMASNTEECMARMALHAAWQIHKVLSTGKMEEVFGVEFNKISYSSSAPQREAMLNGEVDAAVTSLGDFAALLESGDAIGVCEFSSSRNLAYSDVPTCLELGMTEEMLSGSFLAITVPAETPDEVVSYLEGVFKTAVESQEFIDWTATVGITAHYMNSAELTEFVKNLQEKDFKALDELKAQGLI